MGIGLQIIIISLVLSCVFAVLLLAIYFSDKSELAKVLKYLILFGFAGVLIVFTVLFIVGFTGQILDNIFPSRIFENSFNFETNEKVKQLKGSQQYFSSNRNGKTYLEFTTKKEIVEKIIVSRNFIKKIKSSYAKSNKEIIRNLVKEDGMTFYISTEFEKYCSDEFSHCLAFLSHNEKTGKVYFIW